MERSGDLLGQRPEDGRDAEAGMGRRRSGRTVLRQRAGRPAQALDRTCEPALRNLEAARLTALQPEPPQLARQLLLLGGQSSELRGEAPARRRAQARGSPPPG